MPQDRRARSARRRALRMVCVFWVCLAAAALAAVASARAEPARVTSGAPHALAPATISIAPVPTSLRIGERTVVEVRASGLPAFAALSLRLRFDPSHLHVIYAAPGTPVAAGELLTPGFAEQENSVDSAGIVAYSAYSDASPWPSGDGTLARITFEALATGDTALTLEAEGTAFMSPEDLPIEYVANGVTITIQPALLCPNRLLNGGFEATTLTPWATEGLAQRYTGMSHTGHASAWLGGRDYTAQEPADGISQTVSLSAGALTGHLSYWVYIQSEEGATADDQLTVELRNGAGTVLAAHTWTNLDASAAWQQSPPAEMDLSPYAGQTVHLVFHATGDGAGVTSFFVDDVSLSVCEESDRPALPWRTYLPLVCR